MHARLIWILLIVLGFGVPALAADTASKTDCMPRAVPTETDEDQPTEAEMEAALDAGGCVDDDVDTSPVAGEEVDQLYNELMGDGSADEKQPEGSK